MPSNISHVFHRLVSACRKFLPSAGCALACLSNLQAVEFRDIDAIGLYMKKSGADAEKSYSGTFDILFGDGSATVTIKSPYYTTPLSLSDAAGFDPEKYSITEATAYFYFQDDASDSDREEVRVQFTKSKSDKVSGDDKQDSEDDKNNGKGNDYDFSNGAISNRSFTVFSDSLNATILAAIEDGVVNYEIRADKGDFYFDYARLEVIADYVAAPNPSSGDRMAVPDSGSTAALMLLGSAGLLVLARRFR